MTTSEPVSETIRRAHGLRPERPAGPWQRPSWTQPLVIELSGLELLGTYRDRPWYVARSTPSWGELEARPELFSDSDPVLPDGPLLRELGEDGEVLLRPLRAHAPGSLAALLETPAPAEPRPTRPARPVDALARYPLLAGRRESALQPPNAAVDILGALSGNAAELAGMPVPSTAQARLVYRGPRPAARGVETIIALLAGDGVELALSTDREGIIVKAPGGRATDAQLAAIEAASPILLPWLQGQPAPCRVSAHDEPVLAVSVAALGIPWCGECSA